RFINKRLADAARKHRVVVRLKGGDPMLFGRAQEEIAYLRSHGIAVEVVPGITAALAGAADLGVSLTQRGLARSVAFVTPRVGAFTAALEQLLERARERQILQHEKEIRAALRDLVLGQVLQPHLASGGRGAARGEQGHEPRVNRGADAPRRVYCRDGEERHD